MYMCVSTGYIMELANAEAALCPLELNSAVGVQRPRRNMLH